jgi:hypothetical protein
VAPSRIELKLRNVEPQPTGQAVVTNLKAFGFEQPALAYVAAPIANRPARTNGNQPGIGASLTRGRDRSSFAKRGQNDRSRPKRRQADEPHSAFLGNPVDIEGCEGLLERRTKASERRTVATRPDGFNYLKAIGVERLARSTSPG